MSSRTTAHIILEEILLEAGFALQALDEGRNDLARVHLDRLLRTGMQPPIAALLPNLSRIAAQAHSQILEDLEGSFQSARYTLDELMRRAAHCLSELS